MYPLTINHLVIRHTHVDAATDAHRTSVCVCGVRELTRPLRTINDSQTNVDSAALNKHTMMYCSILY